MTEQVGCSNSVEQLSGLSMGTSHTVLPGSGGGVGGEGKIVLLWPQTLQGTHLQ